MKILGMGWIELVIILVVILLIFGPKNLPKLGNAIGKTVSNLRAGMGEGKKKKKDEAENVVKAEENGAETSDEGVAPVKGQLEEAVIEETVTEFGDDSPAAPQVKKVKRVVRKQTTNDNSAS